MANRKNNKGGNSELRGKHWSCPEYVINALKTAVDRYESLNKGKKTSEGYKRAKGILKNNLIEYSQMKRIKNWFDTFEGNHDDMEYRLNGGKTMHNWVDSTLKRETDAIKSPKKIKMETGISNQFIKSHNKDVNKVNRQSLKMKLPKIHKDISGQIWRGKPVYEEVIRMKNLITYKSKI